ncbi:MAG: carboxypeptidase regulatory-like domain-containing protein, partial [Bryobacteraceae bacterium]
MRCIKLFALTSFLLCSSVCFGQTFGTITGEVKDSSGAIVAGASVAVTDKATNAARTSNTNSDGIYSFPSLPPGRYDVSVKMAGFKTELQSNVDLQVQQTVRADFALQPGQVNESIEVSASAEQLNTDNATVGTVIENKRIVELPLNGRDYLQLVQLSPNVTASFGSAQSTNRQGGTRANENMSIAGQRSTFNHYTLDGIENTDVNFNLYLFQPSIDAVQEFKIQTGVYPAEFGRETSQVNVSTKSGTNQYHAALYEFFRNYKLDAAPYAFTSNHAGNQPFKWNQYGFTLGGPLSIPKLFNAKDRLFFMTNFEGFRQRATSNSLYSVPTPAMRNGDFSSLLPRLGAQLYYPTGRSQNANGTYNATPIPGNIIPANLIAPQSLQMLNYLPLPNQPIPANQSPLNDYLLNANNPTDKDQFTVRVDWVESAKSTWFGRYSWTDESALSPTLNLSGNALATNAKQYMISNTRIFSPTAVNEFRFGINSFYNAVTPNLACKQNVVQQLGLPGLSTANCQTWGIPQMRNLGEISGWGDDTNGPYILNDAIGQVIDNFSWIHGKHSFRFGGEVRRDRYNQLGNEFPRGAFTWGSSSTANPNTNTGGYGFAGYLLGAPTQVDGAYGIAFEQLRATSQAYYIDDTWRAKSNLTISLGLRYELTPPYYDRSGSATNIQLPFFASFAGVTNPSLQPVDVRFGTGNYYDGLPFVFPNVQVARDGRLGQRLYRTDYNDWAPRLGIAWTPTPKWSVRTGVGLFYAQDSGNSRFDLARTLGGRSNNVNNNQPSAIPSLTWTNFVSVGSTITIANPTLFGVLYDIRTPRVLQYLLNIEHELSKSMVLEAGYLGSQGHHLQGLYNANEATPGTSSLPNRLPFRTIGIMQTVQGGGNSNYNSLGIKLTRRLSSGLTLLGAYTWAKSIDNVSAIRGQSDTIFPQNSRCLRCERALSAYNVAHRFVLSALYELPFGSGKTFLNRGGVLNEFLGGWQIGSIYTLQTGLPGYPTPGPDQSNTGIGNSRDRLNATGLSQTLNNPSPAAWFNVNAFSLEPFGTFGNAGRNTVIGPHGFSWDFSTHKDFRMPKEGHTLQFRMEAFNFLNHP